MTRQVLWDYIFVTDLWGKLARVQRNVIIQSFLQYPGINYLYKQYFCDLNVAINVPPPPKKK